MRFARKSGRSIHSLQAKGIGGVIDPVAYGIDPFADTSFWYGIIVGLQFSEDLVGDCFITMGDFMNTFTYFDADIASFEKYFKWYNLAVYNPMQLWGNTMALYE